MKEIKKFFRCFFPKGEKRKETIINSGLSILILFPQEASLLESSCIYIIINGYIIPIWFRTQVHTITLACSSPRVLFCIFLFILLRLFIVFFLFYFLDMFYHLVLTKVYRFILLIKYLKRNILPHFSFSFPFYNKYNIHLLVFLVHIFISNHLI